MTLVATETIFGRVVTGWDVEQWVLAVLRKWSNTYLAETERQHGYTAGTFQRVRGWSFGSTFDKWPEDQLPGVLVISPGIVPASPARDGEGHYRVNWQITVGCCCAARTQEKSRELAHYYAAAHALILLQRPSLEGHAAGVSWLNLDYTALDYDDTRSLYAAEATFAIEVPDVASGDAGPVTPDVPRTPEIDPWPGWPTVETVDTDVINEGG